MAITDHSPHSAASRNLTLDGVKKQADEIARAARALSRHRDPARLRGRHPAGRPARFSGQGARAARHRARVAARARRTRPGPADEALRVGDEPSAGDADHAPDQPSRAAAARGYDLDYDRLFDDGGRNRTVLEIDGAPSHLDLDGALARRAIAAGATVAIDSDCHRAEMLGRQMDLGIVTARRGWVEPRHVLNTRSLADVRARRSPPSAPRADRRTP